MPEAAPAAPASESLSPAAATAKIEAILGGDKPAKEQPKAAPKPAPKEEPEEEQQQTEPVPDVPDNQPEPPEEQAQAEESEEPEAEEGEEAESKPEDLVAVELDDGKTYEVPKAVADGILRNKDYTQKTQQLAAERRQLEAEASQVVQERTVYANLLGRLEEAIAQYNPKEPDWASLAQHPDPAVYWQQQALWNEHQRRLNAINEEKGRLTQLQQMDFVEKLKGHLSQAAEKLVEAIPAWKDEKRQKADKERLKEYALQSGFSAEEVARAYDYRVLVWGYKAQKYDEMMSRQVRPQPTLGPRTMPAGPSTGHTTSKATRIAKLKQQVKKTGRMEDGIAAIEALL
jgi:hypothetical protein